MISEQDELPTCVLRNRHNTPHPYSILSRELVLAPSYTLIRAEQYMVRWFLVIHNHKDRSGVAKFPKMRVFVDFLPRKPGITANESVGFGVGRERLADIADGHE